MSWPTTHTVSIQLVINPWIKKPQEGWKEGSHLQPNKSSSLHLDRTLTPLHSKKPAAAADEGRAAFFRPPKTVSSRQTVSAETPGSLRVSRLRLKSVDSVSLDKKLSRPPSLIPYLWKWCSSMSHCVTASGRLLEQFSHVTLWWGVDDRVRARSPFRVSLCTAFSKSFRQRSLQAHAVYKLLHGYWRVLYATEKRSKVLLQTTNNMESYLCINDMIWS